MKSLRLAAVLSLLPIGHAQSSELSPSFFLNSVLFEQNDVLLQTAKEKLTAFSALMDTPILQNSCLLLIGHSDASGGASLNESVSVSRAMSVKNYLVETGKFLPGDISVLGYGEEKLLNTVPPTSKLNRRVEIHVRECR